jgi:hypothetical protein
VDRFVANTLRTLGLIVVSIVVIVASLALGALGLCFTILASADHRGQPPDNTFLYLGIAAAIVVFIGGVFVIGAMARVIFREPRIPDRSQDLPPLPPYSLIPPVPSLQTKATAPTSPPNVGPPVALPLVTPPAQATGRPALDAATHLSPASRVAIDHLIRAIALQASAQLIVGVIEWFWSAQIIMPRFRLHGVLLLAWNLAAIAPYVLLVIAMRRRPGPTAFSFCLVIPGLRSFLGFFGQTASIIIFLRTFHSGMPLLSAIPWALDVLIFYLAWKVIRLTGIQPTPGRLILSAVDIFLYSTCLPIVFLLLTYFWHW